MQLRIIILAILLIFLTGCASLATFAGGDITAVTDPTPSLTTEAEPLKIIIIGGTSGVGLELVELAIARGHSVTAVARRPERLSFSHPNLMTKKGDITRVADMHRLLPGHDVVVSAVGLSPGSRNVTLFSKGISNLLTVMAETGQSRLLAVSAIGAGDSKGSGSFWFDTVLHPLILADDIEDKTQMEQILKENSIDFTVVRPAILTNDIAAEKYRVIKSYQGIETGSISRKDVAHFLLHLAEENTYLRDIVTLSN